MLQMYTFICKVCRITNLLRLVDSGEIVITVAKQNR